jgi:predicted chitinase
MDFFTREIFEACFPQFPYRNKTQQFYEALYEAMEEGEIDSAERMAAFLAQLAHESGQLRYWVEKQISSNPNFIKYEQGRLRNILGNVNPGDGKRYRGRGPIQLTGRKNYRDAGAAIGVDLENNPEKAAHLDVGFRTAVWYWTTRNLNDKADWHEFDAITKSINGGYNGRDDRNSYYVRMLPILMHAEYDYEE